MSEKLTIGIIGNGVVGHATARTWMEHAEVRVHDVIKEKATHGLGEVLSCNLVMICLPEDRVDNFLDLATYHGHINTPTNYILKSTVPIGTTKMLSQKYNLPNMVHMPEFLTERCAVADAMTPSRLIIGLTGNGFNAPLLRESLTKRFPSTQIMTMSSDESEAVKLMTNSFFAVKVAFFNEMRCLSDKLNMDWDAVLGGILSDGRITHSHTQVPGPDGRMGFGGRCLPKDLRTLSYQILDQGLESLMCWAAETRNKFFDRKETS